MQVQKISSNNTSFNGYGNKFGNRFTRIGAYTLCAMLGVGAIKFCDNAEKLRLEEQTNAKEYIQKADSNKYNQIINSEEYQKRFVSRNELGETSFWKEQAKSVEDSMRIDGIAKKAYIDAIQKSNN